MIKIENISVFNFDNALRGARNPLESWDKSDFYNTLGMARERTDKDYELVCSAVRDGNILKYGNSIIMGKNDLKLIQKLVLAGSDERKFMRQIFISMDITAPLYWYKEFDTYKIGTVANSTSTMHTIHKKPISLDMFSIDIKNTESAEEIVINEYIEMLENLRQSYLNENSVETKKEAWRLLIQLLPSSFNQMRTVTMNYENLRNMYFTRRHHKLNEWREFCSVIETLPYAKELICLEKK
jgi:hypothetical protein